MPFGLQTRRVPAPILKALAQRGGSLTPFFLRPPKRRVIGMRRPVLVLVSLALAMLLASGVALAATISGTGKDELLRGTRYADNINARGGDDVVRGFQGADEITGEDGEDRIYAGEGNDRIFSAGSFRDVVDCGPGRDWAQVNRRDRVVNCERKQII